jgi:hypothetical protein
MQRALVLTCKSLQTQLHFLSKTSGFLGKFTYCFVTVTINNHYNFNTGVQQYRNIFYPAKNDFNDYFEARKKILDLANVNYGNSNPLLESEFCS